MRKEESMGVWGSGNFDSDYGREYLDDVVIAQLVATIEKTFRSDPDLDGLGESDLMPSVAIIINTYFVMF